MCRVTDMSLNAIWERSQTYKNCYHACWYNTHSSCWALMATTGCSLAQRVFGHEGQSPMRSHSIISTNWLSTLMVWFGVVLCCSWK